MPRNSIVINVDIGETRVALIEDGILSELYLERASDRSPVGNIYAGRVTRVLPGMQAAFIDVGLERAAFLHVEDVLPEDSFEQILAGTLQHEHHDDADGESDSESSGDGGRKRAAAKRLSRKTPISEVLHEGQSIVVQVSKGPIGTKGARVTSHVSLPGRYVVYMPTISQIGISKRIGNDKERRRLRQAIDAIRPAQGGLVVRTVAAGLTKKQLKADVGSLVKIWEQTVRRKEATKKLPALLYEEPGIVERAARDLFTENVDKISIDDERAFHNLRSFVELFLPERVDDIELYQGNDPIFDEFGIEDEISRALARKVPLPSGGYLIIDQAEALTAIDVNTGRFTGKGSDVEATILQTNLESVKEIGYQLRFRNIGGLIVLDFIDMERASHRNKVYQALREVLKKDKAKTTVIRISELGLVEMTRKRTRDSLSRTLHEPCFYCDGTGELLSKTTLCHEILRQIGREKDSLPGYKITINAHPAICDMFEREEKEAIEEARRRYARQLVISPRQDYHVEQFDLVGS